MWNFCCASLYSTKATLPPPYIYLHALSRARAAIYTEARRNIHFYLFLFPAALAQNIAALSSSLSCSRWLHHAIVQERFVSALARFLFSLHIQRGGPFSLSEAKIHIDSSISLHLLLLSLQPALMDFLQNISVSILHPGEKWICCECVLRGVLAEILIRRRLLLWDSEKCL